MPPPLDGRGLLATNPDGKRWKLRDVGKIKGMVWHQELGDGSIEDVARYHTGDDSHLGVVESIAYTLAIRKNGQVVLCNDLAKATWSQGFKDRPGDENAEFMSVMFEGFFAADGVEDGGEPTSAQMLSGLALWKTCRDIWGWNNSGLYGHSAFGKPSCPGRTLQGIVNAVRFEGSGYSFDGIKGRQTALKRLGHYTGAVDGVWGNASKAALAGFQRLHGLSIDGVWGSATERSIKKALGFG